MGNLCKASGEGKESLLWSRCREEWSEEVGQGLGTALGKNFATKGKRNGILVGESTRTQEDLWVVFSAWRVSGG